MPVKVSAAFMVNQPRMFGFIWTLISPFLSAKIRGRIRLLGSDPAPIFAELPAGIVAAELGGGMAMDNAATAPCLTCFKSRRWTISLFVKRAPKPEHINLLYKDHDAREAHGLEHARSVRSDRIRCNAGRLLPLCSPAGIGSRLQAAPLSNDGYGVT
jgi:hypothetical protein